jgi:hypothetical protein
MLIIPNDRMKSKSQDFYDIHLCIYLRVHIYTFACALYSLNITKGKMRDRVKERVREKKLIEKESGKLMIILQGIYYLYLRLSINFTSCIFHVMSRFRIHIENNC